MRVSVIIPARNAAATIGETFGSLLAQTHSDWEAIVIDDGSTDETAAIARRQAEADDRFRVITGDVQGVGAARNKGLQHARSEWILFLDADDWIVPTHLEKLTSAARDPQLAGAACRYARVSENGTVFDVGRWWQPDRLFEEFARTCPWTVHSVIVKKDLVFEVGGFLPGWKTCEDWDLWQRITRTGARFALVDEPLALYRMTPGSASLDATDMVRGAIATINRGHGPDPRVPHPKPEYANGAAPDGATRARLFAVIWSAALVLGEGRDACEVLEAVRDDRDPGIDPTVVGYSVYLGALLPGALSADTWMDLLPKLSDHIDALLARVEEITGAPFLARRARNYLEYLAMGAAAPESGGRLGRTVLTTVEVTEPIRDLAAAPGVERTACTVLLEGRKIGTVVLPVVDGGVAGAVLADAIADQLWHPIVERLLAASVHDEFARSRHRPAWIGRRIVTALAERMEGRRADFETWALLSIDWVALLAELFPPGSTPGPSEPVHRWDVEVGRPLPGLRAAGATVQVRVTCGGAPIGQVAVRAFAGRVSPGRLRRAIIDACGQELGCLAAREGILGRAIDAKAPLHERLLRRAMDSERWGAYAGDGPASLVGDLPDRAIGTSDSRRVQLPVSLADEAAATFPVRHTLGTGGARRLFRAPECVDAPAAREVAVAPVPAAPAVRRARDLVARLAERAVPALRRRRPLDAIADRLPILMYHTVADDGPAHLAPWRVTPAQFEEQLRTFRDRGYRSVTLDEWRTAKDRRAQLRGRPLLLTFDDGTADFAEAAWPLLRKYGFGAIVFLVAERIGGQNDWDDRDGHAMPLMDWPVIRRLRAEGVEFGSHTCTHAPLAALPPDEVVREGLRSRRLLEEGLGEAVRSIAYPFGDTDAVVAHLMGGCGYRFGLTCRADVSRYSDPLLELPRLHVNPAESLDLLLRRMELRHVDAEG